MTLEPEQYFLFEVDTENGADVSTTDCTSMFL